MTSPRSDGASFQPAPIDHIAIAVEDLEAAIRWYCEGLGMALLEKRTTTGRSSGMISAVLGNGGIPIVLVQGTEPHSQVSRFVRERGPGVQHIGFAVQNLDAGIARLGRLGTGPAIPVIEGDGLRQVFLEQNAFGARVELIERKGGNFSDKSVEQLFRAFEERDLF